jgi:hypothetical protein
MSQKRRSKRHQTKIPRHFVPGTSVDASPGAALEIAVLGNDEEELFGVDLASGAFVRVGTAQHDFNDSDPEPDPDSDPKSPRQSHRDNHEDGSSMGLRRSVAPHVVRFAVGEDEPIDPGRPEAIWPVERPRKVGTIRPRQLRRLLDEVAAEEQPHGLVLGTRAESISYVDRDPVLPSMVLIGLRPKRCRLVANEDDEVLFTFTWGGLRQTLTVHDVRAQSAARAHIGRNLEGDTLTRTLGFKVRYALIGFAPVTNGYVRKVVIRLIGT